MVTKYGAAAVLATKHVATGTVNSPNEAWKLAVGELFPKSASAQSKGCPRGAYLGLCEEGLVKGILAGAYARSNKNKSYAVEIV